MGFGSKLKRFFADGGSVHEDQTKAEDGNKNVSNIKKKVEIV